MHPIIVQAIKELERVKGKEYSIPIPLLQDKVTEIENRNGKNYKPKLR